MLSRADRLGKKEEHTRLCVAPEAVI
uniref:Uncharacterized protein n=1 Tax=Anguilla anguilla TaxID=7936 RepID=A0A0E9RQ71_ANGAN